MGDIEVYSECRLQVSLANGENRNFDRCLIELHQYDFGEYSLRIIDLNNNKSVRIASNHICLPHIPSIGNCKLFTCSS
jgi:hypothetical protein